MSFFTSNWISFQIDDTKDEYFKKVNAQKDKVIIHKKLINEIYKSIPGGMPNDYNIWRYNILVENQKECIKELFDRGLYCSSHYMNLGNGYFDNLDTPNCHYLYKHVINLFNDFMFTYEQAKQTAEILCRIAREVPIESLWKQ